MTAPRLAFDDLGNPTHRYASFWLINQGQQSTGHRGFHTLAEAEEDARTGGPGRCWGEIVGRDRTITIGRT